jgi:hypothetical protein
LPPHHIVAARIDQPGEPNMTRTLRNIVVVAAVVLGGCAGVNQRSYASKPYEQSQRQWRRDVPSSDLREPIEVGLGD